MVDIETWYHTLPPFTKYYFSAACITSVATTINLIKGVSLQLNYTLIFKLLQIWRLFSSFIYFGDLSLNMIISMVILVRSTRALQTSMLFERDFPNFIWCIILLSLQLLCLCCFHNIFLLGRALVFSFIYIWSKYYPQAQLNFWGFLVLGYQLPFVYMGIQLLLGPGFFLHYLFGLVVGHIYYQLRETVPSKWGYNITNTPNFFLHFFQQAGAPNAPRGFQAFQGAGMRIR